MGKVFQPITLELNQYITDCSLHESEAMIGLRQMTDEAVAAHSHLASTHLQAQLLGLMVGLIGAKRAIEIGVFTGYGTLAIAQALPEDGSVIACDVCSEYAALGKPFWEQANVQHKIDLRIGMASDTLQALLREGQAGSFDFIFVDADKQSYRHYYELSLELLRPGGLLILDNMIFLGDERVMDRRKEATRAIDDLNHFIHQDRRVSASLLPIAQGMWLVKKD
jgi:predicted O-methyltransferase YrrM